MESTFNNFLNFSVYSTMFIPRVKNQNVFAVMGFVVTDFRRGHFRDESVSMPPVCRNFESHGRGGNAMANFKKFSLALEGDLKDRCPNDEVFNDMQATGKILKMGHVDRITENGFNIAFDYEGIETQADLEKFLFQHLKENSDKYLAGVMRQREKAAAAGLLKQEEQRKRRGY